MHWIGKKVKITYKKVDGTTAEYCGTVIRVLDLAIIVELENKNKTYFYFKDIKLMEEV